MADPGCPPTGTSPSLSGRAIATSFDKNTIHLVIVVKSKPIYINLLSPFIAKSPETKVKTTVKLSSSTFVCTKRL